MKNILLNNTTEYNTYDYHINKKNKEKVKNILKTKFFQNLLK